MAEDFKKAAELMRRMINAGVNEETATNAVTEVSLEAAAYAKDRTLKNERDRVKKVLDQQLANGLIISPNAYRDILGIRRKTSE